MSAPRPATNFLGASDGDDRIFFGTWDIKAACRHRAFQEGLALAAADRRPHPQELAPLAGAISARAEGYLMARSFSDPPAADREATTRRIRRRR